MKVEVILNKIKYVAGIDCFDLLPYIVMIKIYGTRVTIYFEREKVKVLGLIGPMGKRGCLSTFIVHLGLVDMRVVLPSYYDPFG